MYEHADQSWRARPRMMDPATLRVAAGRIAEHAAAHRLSTVTVVLHGGEPLLVGVDRMRDTLRELRAAIEPVARLDLRMQTNGVLLDERMCDAFVEFDLKVGVSLDGDRTANDRHRRFANGRSSHAQVLHALALLRLPEYARQYAGILATVDVRNDPVQVYRALAAEAPPRLDLLLPHATWDSPPPRPDGDPTPYARWLLSVYNEWTADGRPMPIRLFDALTSAGQGGPSGSEWVGLDRADLVVIETDGSYEQSDSLRTAFDGAPATGMDVFRQAVDAVADVPEIDRRQRGIETLCVTCQTCPVVRQCGGGLYAHRYRDGHFINPSVYCDDLKELILSMNTRDSRPDPIAESSTSAMPTGLLDSVATGHADDIVVGFLGESQLGITRALVATLADRGGEATKLGWDLLTSLDHTNPDAVRSVLGHPYVRAWAVSCLKQFNDGGVPDARYLSAIAAAAAVRAGAESGVNLDLRHGVVHLPTVGSVVIPGGRDGEVWAETAGTTITIKSDVDTSTVDIGEPAGPRWQPVRWLAMDEGRVLLEDLDPYRECHEWKTQDRWPDNDGSRWAALFARAWDLVTVDAPGHVAGLRAGLRAIVPLAEDPLAPLRSSTARHAFGAVATTAADPESLSVMIVHEFQHSILGAVLDLWDLYDERYAPRLMVGWREDPRPIEGVLQGAFAHMAVADIWRVRAMRGGSDPSSAKSQYLQYRDWTLASINAMLDSGGLTDAGNRFVSRMAERLEDWPQ